MTRKLLVLAALLLATLSGMALAAPMPMLLPNVSVKGDTLLLGDIFAHAGRHASDPIAPAPAPGMRATFNSAWLAAVAREHHLDWQPSSDFDETTVVRATRVIDAEAVARRILGAIAPRLPKGDARVQLDDPGLRFAIPAEDSDALALDGLTINSRTDRFVVFVTAAANSADAQRKRVTGRIIYEETVAVPTRGIAGGEIVAPGDVTAITLPRSRVPADAVTDPQQLVGQEARHLLAAGQIVRAADIEAPVVVHRGDLVTMEIDTPIMQLTAQGKALGDGAMDTMIRVANTKSNRVVDAVVAGPNRVMVAAAVPQPETR